MSENTMGTLVVLAAVVVVLALVAAGLLPQLQALTSGIEQLAR